MEQTTIGRNSSHGVKVIVDSVPGGSEWWGIVHNTNINLSAMDKQYDPYFKVDYYDELGSTKAGQLYAVPDSVVEDDWTDVQFGGRASLTDNYYYTAADVTNPGWQNTNVARTEGWHELMFQLSSADGYIHFYLDGVHQGTSVRNDLTNLGTIMLANMFDAPLSGWGENKPFVIFDNVEVGSTSPVPIPGAVWLLGSGLLGLLGFKRRRSVKS